MSRPGGRRACHVRVTRSIHDLEPHPAQSVLAQSSITPDSFQEAADPGDSRRQSRDRRRSACETSGVARQPK